MPTYRKNLFLGFLVLSLAGLVKASFAMHIVVAFSIYIVENKKIVGYNVAVGGGMGMTHGQNETFPRLADVIGFITPDKAIDVLDEAGARTHLSNIHVPKEIEELEKKIELTKKSETFTVNNILFIIIKNNKILFIRSIIGKNKILINMIVSNKECFYIETPNVKFKKRVDGAGDISTALFTHYIFTIKDLNKTLELTTNQMFNIIKNIKYNKLY